MTDFRIIAVTDPGLCLGSLARRCRLILEAGADAVVLRAKEADRESYRKLASEVISQAGQYSEKIILHTYADMAADLGVKSVHLPLPVFRELCMKKPDFLEKDLRVGVSVHRPEEAAYAAENGAAYVTYGHVFATDCKKGLPPRGTGMLAETVRAAGIPVYAIGGISEKNISEVSESGASGACLMSSFMQTPDPAEYMEELRSALKTGAGVSRM